ncbi:MAG: hypothetical protein A2W22_00605 [Candidatus Levybacteria bacterium RBG_16_35_11]|nr:MAG: hypothetical protein A2W22_00605 [Candidatus Levybacteria bacterium RBG_16_35_11]
MTTKEQANKLKPKPFVKWAGGKKQTLSRLLEFKPAHFNRYIEPFVGGGALLFELNFMEGLINDSNEELINCYEIIRDNPEDLIKDLYKHVNTAEYFYEIRKQNSSELTKLERASRLIYLNRTCYNGLWRVNQKNQFNTPFGRYTNPKIVNAELIPQVSTFLKNVKIYCMDFEKFLLENAKEEDFIYLDPPYHPISKYSDFKRYTKDFFGLEEQKRLAFIFKKLHEKGCKLLLSNSYSDFILELYKDFNIVIIDARRNINKNPDGRGLIKEILIKNYE